MARFEPVPLFQNVCVTLPVRDAGATQQTVVADGRTDFLLGQSTQEAFAEHTRGNAAQWLLSKTGKAGQAGICNLCQSRPTGCATSVRW